MSLKKEIFSVLQCTELKQYEYFIKKVVDFEEVWSLRDDNGWATLGNDENSFFPIWPRKEFAEMCASDEWDNYYPESIELEDFIQDWIDGLREDNIRITVMWNNGKGIDVKWDNLKRDLENEMEKY